MVVASGIHIHKSQETEARSLLTRQLIASGLNQLASPLRGLSVLSAEIYTESDVDAHSHKQGPYTGAVEEGGGESQLFEIYIIGWVS